MKKSFVALAALVIAMSMVLSGCGGSSATKSAGGASGGASGGGATAKDPYYIAKPYPTITPESPNEKKAAASIAQALATYITNSELGNKQNNRTDRIFDNKEGYKPRFVGYGFVVYRAKPTDGKWRTLDVCAFDGGTQVKPLSTWDRFGSANKGDGKMNDSYFAGTTTTFDPAQMNLFGDPVSAGEKAAQAGVQAWAKKNLDPAFDAVRLSTYLFEWGEREQEPNMMMSIRPDGFSYNSVIAWGKVK